MICNAGIWTFHANKRSSSTTKSSAWTSTAVTAPDSTSTAAGRHHHQFDYSHDRRWLPAARAPTAAADGGGALRPEHRPLVAPVALLRCSRSTSAASASTTGRVRRRRTCRGASDLPRPARSGRPRGRRPPLRPHPQRRARMRRALLDDLFFRLPPERRRCVTPIRCSSTRPAADAGVSRSPRLPAACRLLPRAQTARRSSGSPARRLLRPAGFPARTRRSASPSLTANFPALRRADRDAFCANRSSGAPVCRRKGMRYRSPRDASPPRGTILVRATSGVVVQMLPRGDTERSAAVRKLRPTH